MADWQFHMRSFDQSTGTWFGVAHAGCGEIGHRHCGVPGCWNCTVHYNPTGGQASEYSPSDWVINFGSWFQLIVDGIKEAIDLGIVIATDGEDEDAVEDAISGAFGIAKDVVQAAIAQHQVNVLDLGKALSENFNTACRDIGMDPKVVNQLAQEMGFAPGTYGLISASTYQAKIYQDNQDINDGHGWVVTRAADGEKVSHYANHAFINNGHLIYMYHPKYVNGFWVTDCPAY